MNGEMKEMLNKKSYELCNNCGKYGHLYKHCKIPITSFGVIMFRINQGIREYLMIRRNDTLGYIDFMRGKYIVSDHNYVLNMIKQMTEKEKQEILEHSFDTLWYQLWSPRTQGVQDPSLNDSGLRPTSFVSFLPPSATGNTPNNFELRPTSFVSFLPPSATGNIPGVLPDLSLLEGKGSGNRRVPEAQGLSKQYKTEESGSRSKFTSLKESGVIKTLLEESNQGVQWKEPEWGFPTGRRNYQEKDYECALRETMEETGYPVHEMKNVKNILPYEEIFLGSNYKSYKHKYYLMYMDFVNTTPLPAFDCSEVSAMEWKTYEKCMCDIRPYNVEKKQMLTNIERTLNLYIFVPSGVFCCSNTCIRSYTCILPEGRVSKGTVGSLGRFPW